TIPTSEVKPLSADDSVEGFHVKVGNRQASIPKPRITSGVFYCLKFLRQGLKTPLGIFGKLEV
ncbi:MAG: hypothetical protein ACRER2_04300, partial [Methylococcales bacterium]